MNSASLNQHLYNGYVTDSLSFGNEFAQNVVIFVLDNSLSTPFENCKNNFLILGEGPTDDTNDSVCKAKNCKCKVLDNTPSSNFYLGSVSKDFSEDETNEISLKNILFDFFN